MENHILNVVFDDNVRVHYDMKEDISSLPGYDDLRNIQGLYQNVQLDLSRTCIYWNKLRYLVNTKFSQV